MKNKLGFTLIEFLIVTVIISVIGLVIVGILNSALRGTKKTNIINTVRVNGNQAMNLMVKTIGYARNFEGVNDGVSDYFMTNCLRILPTPPIPMPTPIKYNKIRVIGTDGIRTTFTCDTGKDGATNSITQDITDSPTPIPIMDTASVKLTSGQCWFTCVQDRVTSDPIIGISFTLEQKSAKGLAENNASMSFETSVAFKNLVK